MDNALKQRILGIIVLFALIGICISVLLHNNKTEREKGIQRAHQLLAEQQQRQTAPTTPPTTQDQMTAVSQPTESTQTPSTPPTTSVFNTTTPTTTSTSAAPTPTATPTQTETSTLNNFTPPVTTTHPATKTTKTKATTTTDTTQKTFIVQVGTFSNKSNATALVKALHERGFNATAQSTKTSHGILTKVIVGGQKGLTKSEAETAKLRLKKTLDLNGIISPISIPTHHTTKKSKTTKKTTTTHHETKSTTTSTTESAVSQKDSGAVVIP